ncbi:MAG: type II toxin-antitoxin system PemK/MazF family toxin [Nanoarchaeota archaeon]
MRSGKKFKFGDVVVAFVQFTDSLEVKTRPALILFEEYGNIVLAGITSNPHMQGIPLAKEEGAVENSIIKLNYIMTVTDTMIKKYLFTLSEEKKRLIREEFVKKLY